MKRRMPEVSAPGTFWSLFDRPGGWILFVLFIGMIAGAIFVQNQFVQQYKRKLFVDTLALPQPEYVKRVALGYDSFLADMLFLRSIQAFGGVYDDPSAPSSVDARQKAIFNYFDVISALDPHFLEAYNFGQLIMGDESGHFDLALRYLRKGQWYNWRSYQPWYDASYIKVYPLKEQDNQAKFYIRQAAKSNDAPDWVARLEHYVDEQAGRFSVSMLGWIESYAHSKDSGDTVLAGIAERRFASTIAEWHEKILQDAADAYFKATGKTTGDIRDLETAGYLPPVEIVDLDLLMQNLLTYEAMEGKLTPYVDQIYQSSVVLKGGVLPNLANPSDPYVLVCTEEAPGPLVTTESLRQLFLGRYLSQYRNAISDFYKKNKRYPASLDELPVKHLDPYCAGWKYDPFLGLIMSKAREDL